MAMQFLDDWLARAFRPVSLRELEAKAAMLERLDNKYVVHAAILARALGALGRRFDVLEIDGQRQFTYETCYFDDENLRSFHDHQQGRRLRMKVRTRKYVEAGLCFVEVKLKDRRGITVKRRMPYDPARHGTLDPLALEHIDRAVADQYGRPRPEGALAQALHMRYRRATLVARDGGERMTIDGDLCFMGSGSTDDACEYHLDDQMFIVETKSTNGHGLADAILRALHQHPTNGCSKYCVGMSVTGAVTRFNRFRPALRRLGAL